ncbi:hypothetical protein ACFL9S_10900 [Erwinia sp. AnSW2-5]|uniref:hypothetical protein n=1 Tax=Erwinia sp. AnSW2-5 TaxID=3367692 RepID=UPI00385E6479
MINELIEQIGGRITLNDLASGLYNPGENSRVTLALMARALLAVLDAKAELWEIDNPGEGSRYSAHERKPGDWDYSLVKRGFYGVPTVAHSGTQIFQLRDSRQWYDVDRDIYDENIPFQEGRIVYSDVPPAASVPGAWFAMCGDWRDENVAIHGDSGLIVSGIEPGKARAIIYAHNVGAETVSAAAAAPGGVDGND